MSTATGRKMIKNALKRKMEKGIISVEEAREAREEAKEKLSQSSSSKKGGGKGGGKGKGKAEAKAELSKKEIANEIEQINNIANADKEKCETLEQACGASAAEVE